MLVDESGVLYLGYVVFLRKTTKRKLKTNVDNVLLQPKRTLIFHANLQHFAIFGINRLNTSISSQNFV